MSLAGAAKLRFIEMRRTKKMTDVGIEAFRKARSDVEFTIGGKKYLANAKND